MPGTPPGIASAKTPARCEQPEPTAARSPASSTESGSALRLTVPACPVWSMMRMNPSRAPPAGITSGRVWGSLRLLRPRPAGHGHRAQGAGEALRAARFPLVAVGSPPGFRASRDARQARTRFGEGGLAGHVRPCHRAPLSRAAPSMRLRSRKLLGGWGCVAVRPPPGFAAPGEASPKSPDLPPAPLLAGSAPRRRHGPRPAPARVAACTPSCGPLAAPQAHPPPRILFVALRGAQRGVGQGSAGESTGNHGPPPSSTIRDREGFHSRSLTGGRDERRDAALSLNPAGNTPFNRTAPAASSMIGLAWRSRARWTRPAPPGPF